MNNQFNPMSANQPYQSANKCHVCGGTLAPGQAFCTYCGTPVSQAAPNPQPQATPTTKTCSTCGTVLQNDTVFCPMCGNNVGAAATVNTASAYTPTPTPEPVNTPTTVTCSACGTQVNVGTPFCPICGNVIPSVAGTSNPAIDSYNSQITKKKPNVKKILIPIVAVILVIALAIALIPALIETPEELLAEGNYIEAYEKSDDYYEKQRILDENLVAYISEMCVDTLKDSYSFQLRDAWVNRGDDNTRQIVLKVAANNSYGNIVINYWMFTYDREEYKYEYMASYSTLTEESTYSWQTTSEKTQVILDNLVKGRIAEIMADYSLQISSTSVDNINNLFNSGKLNNIQLLTNNY